MRYPLVQYKARLFIFISFIFFLPMMVVGDSFYDDFKTLSPNWKVTSTGKLGGSEWAADHALVKNGCLILRHTLAGGFKGAEVEHQKQVHYGRLSAKMKAGKAGGVLSTIFLYFEEKGKVHEIDIELFPDQADSPNFTSYMDWTESDDYKPGPHYFHEQPQIPGFDCREWHVYTIDWLKDRVVWYIDGKKVSETHEIVPFQPESIMLNSWYPDTWAKAKPDEDSEQLVKWVRWEDLKPTKSH